MNWPALMAIGFGVLRLPPAIFWGMTPREFSAAMEGAGLRGAAPMTRVEMKALANRFPDEVTR